MGKEELMKFATSSSRRLEHSRLLVISNDGEISHSTAGNLPDFLNQGDVVVVNDAATMPSSLSGILKPSGEHIEIRLGQALEFPKWKVILFGKGDWRTPTENRTPPPVVTTGSVLEFPGQLTARVLDICNGVSERLIEVEFLESETMFWRKFYAAAKPIQYSYLKTDLELWDQQTVFSGPPIAIEPPSASFPLTWDIMFRMQKKGVEILSLSHGTGLSNTGVNAIDKILPFPEPYFISLDVQERILQAKSQGRRIIAIGTGVVRALESWAGRKTNGDIKEVATLKLTPEFKRKIVTGIFSGLHEPGASHIDLLTSFVSPGILARAYAEAEGRDYLWHEYGDVCLIL